MDTVIYTRSLGTPAEGVKDQYADGIAAKVWEIFIGDIRQRKENYVKSLVGLLREKGCKRILDVACGTGIDSTMLLEEGFEVVSVDASDKMLKYALKTRWERRKEDAFDKWIIEEANWLTIDKDIEHLMQNGFDAVVCLGNSFAHMLDSYGDQREQKLALSNFERCVKPGGLLLIDHRNYDYIISTGKTPSQCIYYNSKHLRDITTSVMYTNGDPSLITLEYRINMNGIISNIDKTKDNVSEFRLSYYPHKLKRFTELMQECFPNHKNYTIYGDFVKLSEIKDPGVYIHVLEKSL